MIILKVLFVRTRIIYFMDLIHVFIDLCHV